mgnify:CR=1 FL=1
MYCTKNFQQSEFACKCGCGFDDIDPGLMDIAQKIRNYVGVPVRVNSGCRCERHNARVGGVKGSFHTKGKACDLSCSKGAKALFEAVKALREKGEIPGLKYCIYYAKGNFVHIDVGRDRGKLYEVRN